MAVLYPYTLSNLDGAGTIPLDGEPVRAVHFNRLFRELVSIEAALGNGRQLRGDAAAGPTLDDRLSGEMAQDGGLEREMLTDDDPSGNRRGAVRFFDSQVEDIITTEPSSTNISNIFIKLAYSAWDEPPCFFFIMGADAGTWQADWARRMITATSEVGARINVRRFNGASLQNTIDGELHWLTVSRNFKVWEDNVAWALRPVRTGS